MKILGAIGVIGLGAYLVSRVRANLRASKKIEVAVTGERVGINYQGVTLKLGFIIKNPTKAKLELTHPLIKIKVGEKLLASSTIEIDAIPLQNRSSKGRIVINPFAQTEKIYTSIDVPFTSILKLGTALLQRFQSGEKVQVEIETIAQVYTSIGNFPHDDVTKIEL